MINREKRLPIGVDSFRKLITEDYYYLDKTGFIKELLLSHGEVNLFTRPRRFGKTLNMSMLKSFFEIGAEESLFKGLMISKEDRLCEEYLGRFPVVFLSLKEVMADSFGESLKVLARLISLECERIDSLAAMKCGTGIHNSRFMQLKEERADEISLRFALSTIMQVLHKQYAKQVVLLIDEYDVPLDKANEKGYYRQMADFLRGFFGAAFKTNSDLYFAVITGCLRISKESIFTGVNNLKVDTISDNRYDEYFGFTDENVKKILKDYDCADAYKEIKEWYDGYRFGNAQVYCPWDVVNHCDRLLSDRAARPRAYWNNTSSNMLVKRFIDLADFTTRREIEDLVNYKTIYKKLIEDLTYDELEDSREHLWSVLYLTGYLTTVREPAMEDGRVGLVIPNREVREIFIEKIQKWFMDGVQEKRGRLNGLYQAFMQGDEKGIERNLTEQLQRTISYYDCYEGFYHGFLLGLLQGCGDWAILSNREAGTGRSDLQIECGDGKRGIIIEVKHTKERSRLSDLCEEALNQITNKGYAAPLLEEDITDILCYGITFCKKSCCVHGRRL